MNLKTKLLACILCIISLGLFAQEEKEEESKPITLFTNVQVF
jgi:hypothetical protein